jgi:ABC-type nitrate/sulfonate/bicarbonate transport system permease component
MDAGRPVMSRLARVSGRLDRFLLPVGFLVCWELVSGPVAAWVSPALAEVLPPPSRVLADGWAVLTSGDLLWHVAKSLSRVLGGVIVAASVAIPVGCFIGLSPLFEDLLDPVVEFFRPIPPPAWIPLGILWFGIGDAQNVFITSLGAFFPIVLNTIAAVRGVDRALVWGALTLGGAPRQVLREIVLPGALPLILTGLRIGLGVGWMALVAAEIMAARAGLGFMIQSARYALLTERVVLGMAVIGLLGVVLNRAMRALERRLVPWYGASH